METNTDSVIDSIRQLPLTEQEKVWHWWEKERRAWKGEWQLERAGREILRGPVVSGDNHHRVFAVKTAFSANAPVIAAYESTKETSMKKLVIATAVALAAIISAGDWRCGPRRRFRGCCGPKYTRVKLGT